MATKKGRKFAKKKLNGAFFAVAVAVVLILAALFVLEYFRPGSVPFLSGIYSAQEGTDDDSQNGGTKTPLENIDVAASLIVYYLDVGQGDSILLRFPGGTDFLIDAGSGANASAGQVSDYLAALAATGLDDIEYLLATHPDSDHINLLDDVLVSYEVENIYYNGYVGTSQTFKKFDEAAQAEAYGEGLETPLTLFDGDGEVYTVRGEGFSVTVYAPGYERFGSDINAMSPIVIAEYGGRKLVFTGDAEVETEQWFMETVGGTLYDCDILKVGHHGSSTSSSSEFLDFISCEYAVISAGEGNSYGHPHQATLDKLNFKNCTVYRTDLHGTVKGYVDADGDIAFVTEKEGTER